MNIADNIKRLREERLLTQEQLSEALGITVGAVYKSQKESCGGVK